MSTRVSFEGGRHQAGRNSIQLAARISKPCDLDDCAAHRQPRSSRKREQVETSSRDVLANLTWSQVEPQLAQLVEKLRMEKMYLTKIGLAWIANDPGAVLHRLAEMRVSLHAESDQESNSRPIGLGHRVGRAAADGFHDSTHPRSVENRVVSSGPMENP